MPYTLAHPAIILPLRRFSWLTFAGLFLGAMAPDYEHVLRLNVVSTHSHTLPGLLYFCLPVGLLSVWLYRSTWSWVLADFFPQIKPGGVMIPFWKEALSVFIGACSHLFWDSFTHAGRWGVRMFPILNSEIDLHLSEPVFLWNFLQHFSSILGLAILIVSFGAQAQRHSDDWIRRKLPRLLALAFLIVVAAAAFTYLMRPGLTPKMVLVHTSNHFIAILAIVLTLWGAWRRREAS